MLLGVYSAEQILEVALTKAIIMTPIAEQNVEVTIVWVLDISSLKYKGHPGHGFSSSLKIHVVLVSWF